MEKISMAPVQGWHTQIEKWSKFLFGSLNDAKLEVSEEMRIL